MPIPETSVMCTLRPGSLGWDCCHAPENHRIRDLSQQLLAIQQFLTDYASALRIGDNPDEIAGQLESLASDITGALDPKPQKEATP
jgi:hypothetical protein